jgi:hypothetical protein
MRLPSILMTPILLTTLSFPTPVGARQIRPASPALQRASRLARGLKPRTPLGRRAPLLRAAGKLDLKSRYTLAGQLVGRRLGWSDRVTIRKAHLTDKLARKQRILRKRFSAKETRLLMESGVTGLKQKLIEAFAVWNAGDGESNGRVIDKFKFAEKHGLNKRWDPLFGERTIGSFGEFGASAGARGHQTWTKEDMRLFRELGDGYR